MLQEAINFIYRNAKKFRRKHPLTIAFRLKAHSKILAKIFFIANIILLYCLSQNPIQNF